MKNPPPRPSSTSDNSARSLCDKTMRTRPAIAADPSLRSAFSTGRADLDTILRSVWVDRISTIVARRTMLWSVKGSPLHRLYCAPRRFPKRRSTRNPRVMGNPCDPMPAHRRCVFGIANREDRARTRRPRWTTRGCSQAHERRSRRFDGGSRSRGLKDRVRFSSSALRRAHATSRLSTRRTSPIVLGATEQSLTLRGTRRTPR
jgi:hypothetical protein